jgi:hypothetical protein
MRVGGNFDVGRKEAIVWALNPFDFALLFKFAVTQLQHLWAFGILDGCYLIKLVRLEYGDDQFVLV